MSRMKEKISITLDDKLLKKIDRERGMIPRSVYINYLLRKILKK